MIGAGNPLTGSISYQKGTTISFIWKGHEKMGLCGLVSLWYKRKHIWGDFVAWLRMTGNGTKGSSAMPTSKNGTKISTGHFGK